MTTFRLISQVRPSSRAPTPSVQDRAGAAPPRQLARAAPAASAVPVPWRVTARSTRGVVEVEHHGDEPLRAVRFSLAGDGLLGLSLPRTVHPRERLRVVVRGGRADAAVAAPDAMLVLRWFESDGTELLWPIAL